MVHAPREAVVAALLDFEGQNGIVDAIREVRVVGALPGGGTLVRLITEFCVGPFCVKVRQRQLVRFLPPGLVTALAVPDGSDLESGYTMVEATAEGAQTRLRIECMVRPRKKPPFFVPRRWVLNALARQARQGTTGIERLAQILSTTYGLR
ncbi:MAG TPA: SRPBCC family protein [Anaeromyxobacteraceae bacterium]|nr:SRPBCC family protein [Anaeromyxobacteraceae bacterium]